MRLSATTAIASITLLTLFLGCSGSNEPKASELGEALAKELPDYLSVTSFNVEAMENTGNDVEPNYVARFTAVAETQAPLYAADGRDRDLVFVKETTPAGESIELFGKSASELYQGGWRHLLRVDGNPAAGLGRPLESFRAKKTLIRGSDEEKAHFAALEAANAEFNTALKGLPVIEMLTEFYNTSGQWAGQFVVHEVIASRNEKQTNDFFEVHAKYSYRKPTDTEPQGEDRRTFSFQKVNGQWQVVRMGGAGSGRI